MDDRSKVVLLREIDRYLGAGRELFPLKPGKKTPLETGWQTTNYTRQALHTLVHRRGCNIGWRLGDQDVIIDVDPRHRGAAESENALTEKWGLGQDLNAICPTVHTGGEDHGRHYYTKAPRSVKLKTDIADFSGIDFRRKGHYVVIAGSLHPDTGRAYHWDLFCPHESPELPDWLFDLLTADSLVNKPKQVGKTPTTMTVPEIDAHLSRIPATKHQGYDDWLKIGMAVHSACDGSAEGEELWVAWSTSDPVYCDAEEAIRARWQSFSTKDTGVTVATLVAAAMLDGGSPNGIPANIAFDAPIESAPSITSVEDFRRMLFRANPMPMKDAIERACDYGAVYWDDLRQDIKLAYKARLTTIDQAKAEYRKERKQKEIKNKRKALARARKNGESRLVADPAIDVAEHLLAKQFDNGAKLIHAKNQQFYEYVGTHWEPVPPNEINQMIFNSAEELQLDPGSETKFRTSTLFAACEKVLVAKTARRKDVFRFSEPPPPVVNTTNAEVWINRDGAHEALPHSPESYLLSCLNTEFDPKADCPVFDKTLQEIFDCNDEPAEMARHLYEFFGYVMQPYKNIPTWWMFQGDGSNGKTFCFNLYQRLLGSAVLPRPVEDFADSGRNNHALASLVGKLLIMDDDARVDAFLPESAIKKLSESKLFEANPKRQHAFTFMSCATPVMLINDWPRIRDLSWGLIRKAYILPFRRVLNPDEYDLGREPYIIENELPGVLNASLAGYHRLRKRGKFAEPAECGRAKEEWLQAASPLIDFSKTQIRRTGNGSWTSMHDVYQRYLVWCHNVGGVRQPAAKHRFEISLKQMGFKLGDRDNVRALLSATLEGSAEDVF